MRWQSARRIAVGLAITIPAVFTGALCMSSIAQAGGYQLKPIVITPASGCGLLTTYTAGTGLAP
jgi:hypothetical protein